METVRISHPNGRVSGQLRIGGSKSISNRVLILNALSADPREISNLSDSDDTQALVKLLHSGSDMLDAHHAGTTFRFMTAFLCLQEGSKTLTGSERMKQRPIGPLVEALRAVGAEIEYLEKKGYPPLKISGPLKQQSNKISIAADISSQFISALCMIAPCLKEGLHIELEGELVSRPYLEMTLGLMEEYGVVSSFKNNLIKIVPQAYQATAYTVESDWSSASYHFAMVALSREGKIELEHYEDKSRQGDSVLSQLSKVFGVKSSVKENVLTIEKDESGATSFLEVDYLDFPDLAQTIAVILAGLNVPCRHKGLKTLSIKETDRVAALEKELAKVGISLAKDEQEDDSYMQSGTIVMEEPVFETYQDHRMAMAFAPLALRGLIQIENPKVVTKSYPNFWKDLETLGFLLEFK